jgi:serine protease Do
VKAISIAILNLSMLAGSAWCSSQTAPPQPTPPPPPRVHVMKGPRLAYLGVNIEDVTADRVSALKLKDERGVEVTLVDQDAPAGKAGLQPHDVIVSYNGTPVEGEEQFRRLIRETPVGRKVQLGIVRNGSPLTLTATVGSHPEMRHNFAFAGPVEIPDIHIPEPPDIPDMPDMDFDFVARTAPTTGIVAESLTPQLAQYFGAKRGEGVLVRSVEKNSAAEKAGVRAGDVITKVNGETVGNRSDLRRALRDKSGSVSVSIIRDKREQTLTMAIPERKRGSAEPTDWELDLRQLKSELKDLGPQMEDIKLAAKQQSEELLKNKDFIRKQMEQARKDLERSMQQLQRELKD